MSRPKISWHKKLVINNKKCQVILGGVKVILGGVKDIRQSKQGIRQSK